MESIERADALLFGRVTFEMMESAVAAGERAIDGHQQFGRAGKKRGRAVILATAVIIYA